MDILQEPSDQSDNDVEFQDEQMRLRFLRRKSEYGHIRALVGSLKKNEKLRHSRFPHNREEFLAIEAAAIRGSAIEEQHGTGSLLNLDHPFVQKLAAGGAPEGGPIIPPSYVQAARNYRTASGIRALD